jgi:hypothetical protein
MLSINLDILDPAVDFLALAASMGLPARRIDQADELQGVAKRGPNPGANADDRGLYLYNPVTVPLSPAY